MRGSPFTYRLANNTALNVLSLAIPVALSFIVTPVLLNSLGHELYGLYLLILGFINYSFIFSTGKTAAKYVAEFRAEEQHQIVNEAVSSVFWMNLIIGVTGALLVITFRGFLADEVLQVPASLSDLGDRSFLAAAVIIVLTMAGQVWAFVLQGLQRFASYAAITTGASVLLSLGSIYLAFSGFGVLSIFFWSIGVTAAVGLVSFVVARRYLIEPKLLLNVRPSVRNVIMRYGGAIVLSQIFGNILLLFERSWITRNFGLEALTYYVVPMTVALLFHGLIGNALFVLFPVVNERLANKHSVLNIYRSSTKTVIAFVAFAIMTAAILGHPFLTFWVGGEVAARSYPLLVIHVATFGIVACSSTAWLILESYGQARLTAIFSLVWLIIGGVVMVALSGHFGIEGVGVGRFAGCLAAIPLMIFAERTVLGAFSVRYWLSSLIPLLTAIIVAAFVEWLSLNLLGDVSATIAGSLTAAGIFTLALIKFRYFDQEDLSRLRRAFGGAAH